MRAAHIAADAGADGITAHLREDRRHITDDDIDRLMAEIDLPLNLEMAATEEMLEIALRHRPHAACIVPEQREERTTEGGLDAAGQHNHLAYYVDKLGAAGHPRQPVHRADRERQVEAAMRLGAPVVEFHTGRYAHAQGERAIDRAQADQPTARRSPSRTGSNPTPATASPSTMSCRSPPSRRSPNSTSAIS